MNFMEMTTANLLETHSEMLATASDLGYQVPLAMTITEADPIDKMISTCEDLHAAIEKYRAGIDQKDVVGTKTGSNKVLADKPKKKQAAKAATKVAVDEPKKEAEMAEAAKKKSPAKKATKKGAAKKAPAKKASAARAPSVDETKKINWVFKGEGNGCREGTEKHARHDLVRKCSGQTVKSFLSKGGLMATLNNCVAQGKAKLS